jgi:DNA-binding phage protein
VLGGLAQKNISFWNKKKPNDELIDWQEWVISVLKELRTESLFSEVLSWKAFFTSLASGMEQQKGYSRLARLAGIDRPSLYEWVGGTVTPSLELILKFCYACGTTPMQIMANPFASLERALRADLTSRSSLHSRPPRKHFDRERGLSFLQSILDGREEVLSVRQAAMRLNCAARVLRFHFPSECEQITQKYREYRRQQREKYLEGVREEVRNATMTLHMQGISPTRRSVAALPV